MLIKDASDLLAFQNVKYWSNITGIHVQYVMHVIDHTWLNIYSVFIPYFYIEK